MIHSMQPSQFLNAVPLVHVLEQTSPSYRTAAAALSAARTCARSHQRQHRRRNALRQARAEQVCAPRLH